MNFFSLTAMAVFLIIISVGLAIFIPRIRYAVRLRKQVQQVGGHVFTPDSKTWQGYLARNASFTPLLSILVYAGLLAVIIFADIGPVATAAGVGFGVYMLLRFLLYALPPTYGVTGQGITILSWLPNYPLGPFGSGSGFIPWQSVEICAIDTLFFVVLTKKMETRVVYPPDLEEKVCSFIDSLLRRRGYETNAS